MDDERGSRPEEAVDKDPAEGVRIIGAEEAAEALQRGDVVRRRPDDEPRFGDRPASPPDDHRPALRFPLDESADPADLERPPLAGSTAGAALPHWTEPATGEVPRILPETEGSGGEDDLDAWSSFASQTPRWREEGTDWDAGNYEDMASLAGDEPPMGALDERRAPMSDMFSFNDPEPEPPATTQIRTGGNMTMPGVTNREGGGERNLPVAVGTGVALIALAALLSTLGPGPLLGLVTVVIGVAAVEFFSALRQVGYTPATLLGIVATGSFVLAAYWRGEAAFPLVLFLTVVFGLLWYLSSPVREHVTTNLGVTVLGTLYIGGLGAFAALLLKFPNGVGMLWGAILATVAYDVGGLFVGSSAGRAPLAPTVSPNKTVEGLMGAAAASVLVSVILVGRITPWNEFSDALLLGVTVAVAATLGDLCESLLKRDLGLKDMGTLLPGHGGVLDRFDALLFVLPATYYLVRLLDLV